MMDIDTFVTTLYVLVDDFCKDNLPSDIRRGPEASLSRSEVITLSIFGQWSRFESERGFYRWAKRHLHAAFPTLPNRSQFNRLQRRYYKDLVAFFLHLVEILQAQTCQYEILDSSAVPVRDAKRRGSGWLYGMADIGWSNRIGWYEGFHLLCAVNPAGMITGFGFGSASTKDQSLAETFFALRAQPHFGLQTGGRQAFGPYVTDKGFEGQDAHQRWWQQYGAQVITPPKRNSKKPWPKRLRQWLASLRQIVESVYDKLHNTFRLNRERPHNLAGFHVRLTAKIVLHNFCIWVNLALGRPRLAFAELIEW